VAAALWAINGACQRRYLAAADEIRCARHG